MNLRLYLSVMLVLLLPAPGSAQGHRPVPPLPEHGPSPLLFVRFGGLEGMRVTFYQGRAPRRTLDAPTVVGMRPGYRYQVELSQLPGHPGVSLYPTLEVLGSLHLPPRVEARTFPAPITIHPEDVEAVQAGALLTKVIYLENPDGAVPASTTSARFLEFDRPPGRSLIAEAKEAGRLLVILRMGQRPFTHEELARQSVYGTILYPDEKVLARPTYPPLLLPANRPPYDPYHGPRWDKEEFLHDGGDRGLRAGVRDNGEVGGLDPEDTVAEYTDSRGARRLTHSNRVCLLVPRFVTLRQVVGLETSEAIVYLGRARLARQEQQIEKRTPPRESRQHKHLRGLRGRQRPSINLARDQAVLLQRVKVLDGQALYLGPIEFLGTKQIEFLDEVQRALLRKKLKFTHELSRDQGPQQYEQVVVTSVVGRIKDGAQVVRGLVETRDLTVCCHETPRLPDKPLVLVKCADRDSARPGDVVTFTLKYSNLGGRAITDVAVTDSLSPRLEYVPGSTRSDRNAVFTTQDNEAGSVILRWEISGTLQPGESGRLLFQARVR
jgi:uncharacterized repeat protein (TIGR01451 family)